MYTIYTCNYTGIPLKVIGRRKLEKIRMFSRVAQPNDVGSFDPIILSYSIIQYVHTLEKKI